MPAALTWGPHLWDVTDSGCWEWNRNRDWGGYGVWRSLQKAHRVAWAAANRPLEPGEVVRHTCDNPPCVRPDHLEVGVQAQNIQDMDARGRRYAPTHCPRGHEYTPENTYRNGKGARTCRTCAREATRQYRERKKIS